MIIFVDSGGLVNECFKVSPVFLNKYMNKIEVFVKSFAFK